MLLIGASHLPNLSTAKAISIALIITFLMAVAAIVIALLLLTSGSATNSIGTYAGGLSSRFVALLALALPFIFALLFLILRRAVR